MFKRLLKRALLGTLLIVATAALAGVVWWKVAGKDFLYGIILPDSKILLEGQEIPELTPDAFGVDLAFLEAELPRLHVDYELAFSPEEVSRKISQLRSRAGSLSPDQRALELFGLLALGRIGTGHTMVFPFQKPLDWRLYPLSTYWFSDGLFLTAAEGELEGSVGSRVVSIGGLSVADAVERLEPYVSSDNNSSLRGNLPRLLGMAEPLIALGLASVDGILELELEQSSPVRVEPVSLTSFRGMAWSRRQFAPVEDGWSPADQRPRKRNYVLDYFPESETLIFSLDLLENQGDESLAEFAERLVEVGNDRDIQRFVIDLRRNTGGNNALAEPLVRAISDHPVLDRKGSLFVLLGRHTFSAAANFACALERRTKAVFVGETSGFSPNHLGDAVSVALPGSKVVTRLASRRWQEDLPGVRRAALEPDLKVEFLSRHHFENVDPAFDAIESHRSGQRPASPTLLERHSIGTYLLSPFFRLRLFNDRERGRLAIDGAGPYAVTDLYSNGAATFSTDIRGMTLEVPANDAPTLHWHGASWLLERAAVDHRLPIELIQDGEVELAARVFRASADTPLSSHFELAINRLAYQALSDGRIDDAVLAFTVNTELFPGSANTWDSLGDALKAAGRLEDARESYRRALSLDAAFGSSLARLEELGG